MRKLALLFFSGLLANASLFAQRVSIVPEPAEIIQPKIAARLPITAATRIRVLNDELVPSANFLNDYLKKIYGFSLSIVTESYAGDIVLDIAKTDYKYPGAYQLQVNNKGVTIAGDNANGVFYGVQTLLQLISANGGNTKITAPYIQVKDYPRFAYRGMHLDVGRHFFGVDFIKRYIDYMAYHKLNYFHWHLTEDQGWRIEIKQYPKLTEVGAWRNGTVIGRYPGTGNTNEKYGGFYTQDEIREIVKYAESRYITIIPEIELPGHAAAAIAAYPELSCFPDVPTIRYYPKESAWEGDSTGKQVIQSWGVYDDVFIPSENTFKFLENVFDEVLSLFPSKYIHIGGDECPKTNWKNSAFCQQLIKEKGLKDEHGLQSYFIQRIEKYLNGKGRTIIGWDEILEGGLAPNALVMSWRGEEGGIAAAKENHEVIMTPGNFVYFDHSQTRNEDSVTIGGYTPLDEIYGYEPIPAELPADKQKYILGAQANVWTEYMNNPSKVEYMIFPRMSALSEVLWSQKNKRDFKAFEQKIPAIMNLYKQWGNNYSRAYFDLKVTVGPANGNNGVQVSMGSPLPAAKPIYQLTAANGNNGSKAAYTKPLVIRENGQITAWTELNGSQAGPAIKLNFATNKATGKKLTLTQAPSKKYPGQGGSFGLVNGLRSEKGMNSTEWLGWEGGDLEATIDLGAGISIKEVAVHIAESKGSWIYAPAKLEVSVSTDGKTFRPVASQAGERKNEGNSMQTISLSLDPVKARYVKVKAANYGTIPDGQAGAGHKAWLFADEIVIN